jgi:RNA recognition motif-containing protein
MNKKLYIGGLPYSTTQDGLRDGFAAAGNVESAIIITDKMSGRSKGFGFVEFANEEDAAKAIEMFNGKDFEGRRITVSEARPMEPRAPRGNFNRDNGNDFNA